MASKVRIQKIADRIREELAIILLQEISDPRLVGIMVSDVTVDREIAFAEIYVSSVEGSTRAEEAIPALNNAQGYFRRVLSDRIELRVFPRLRFHWDPTAENAEKMEKLINSLHDKKS